MTHTETLTRWDRLAADLAAAGVDVKVDARPYAESVYGRIHRGVTRSISLRVPAGLVEVCDRYGRGGKWYGWQVVVSDRESIIVRTYPATTRRAEVVAAVVEATA